MKKRWIFAALCLAALLAAGIAAGISAYRCGKELTVKRYQIPAKVAEPVRIVQLTDLHSWEFGEENRELAALVAAQEPDLILMTGDMLDRSDENGAVVCALIEALTPIAPVYYGYGNHEYAWMQRCGESLTPALTAAGAVVLDVEYADILVNGQQLRIGGYHGYYRQPGMFEISPEQRRAELDFAEDFENTDACKILLCHIPTAWLDWGYIHKFPVDLVLAGHYHGGQIRLPLAGGVYAPYIGLFPPYTDGFFQGEMASCVLSAGLGSSPGIPRINNLPEIVVVDLTPES